MNRDSVTRSAPTVGSASDLESNVGHELYSSSERYAEGDKLYYCPGISDAGIQAVASDSTNRPFANTANPTMEGGGGKKQLQGEPSIVKQQQQNGRGFMIEAIPANLVRRYTDGCVRPSNHGFTAMNDRKHSNATKGNAQ